MEDGWSLEGAPLKTRFTSQLDDQVPSCARVYSVCQLFTASWAPAARSWCQSVSSRCSGAAISHPRGTMMCLIPGWVRTRRAEAETWSKERKTLKGAEGSFCGSLETDLSQCSDMDHIRSVPTDPEQQSMLSPRESGGGDLLLSQLMNIWEAS